MTNIFLKISKELKPGKIEIILDDPKDLDAAAQFSKMLSDRLKNPYIPCYYDRQGKEIDLMDWGMKCEDMSYKVIKQENFDRWFISTVWIGMNMSLFRKLPPLIFETMIFLNDTTEKENDPLEHFMERYFTEAESLKGHEEAVSICRAQLLIEKRNEELDEKL